MFHTCLYVCDCMWTYASVCVCHIPTCIYIYIWSSMHTHLWSMCRILQPKPSLLTRSNEHLRTSMSSYAKHQGMAAKRGLDGQIQPQGQVRNVQFLRDGKMRFVLSGSGSTYLYTLLGIARFNQISLVKLLLSSPSPSSPSSSSPSSPSPPSAPASATASASASPPS